MKLSRETNKHTKLIQKLYYVLDRVNEARELLKKNGFIYGGTNLEGDIIVAKSSLNVTYYERNGYSVELWRFIPMSENYDAFKNFCVYLNLHNGVMELDAALREWPLKEFYENEVKVHNEKCKYTFYNNKKFYKIKPMRNLISKIVNPWGKRISFIDNAEDI